MEYKSGYDHKTIINAHLATMDELRNLPSHIQLLDLHGEVRNVKVTSVKTWKRKPNDIDIHWKYGLYEYGVTSYVNGVFSSGNEIVIED